jgi:hypothetical protein
VAINKERSGMFSIAVAKPHIERINAIVKDELPDQASRNALFGAICALITPEEARSFYERGMKSGAVGPSAENAKKRKLATELAQGISVEELELLLAQRKAKAAAEG